MDDGTNDSDEMVNGRRTYESYHSDDGEPIVGHDSNGTAIFAEPDMTPWFTDIELIGGNILQGNPSSRLWRPRSKSATLQAPLSSPLPAQLPRITRNLPTAGTPPAIAISPGADLTVHVGELSKFTVSCSSPHAVWSPNLPAGTISSIPLPASLRQVATIVSWKPAIDQIGKHTITFICSDSTVRTGFGVVSVTVLPNPAIQPIDWVELTKATKSSFPAGSWAEKTLPGVDGQWDSEATSSQRIQTDGSISFRFSNANHPTRMALRSPDSSGKGSPIEFAMVLLPHTGGIPKIQVLDGSGHSLGSIPYSPGDACTLARNGGVITYYRNSSPLFTTPVPKDLPLVAKCAFSGFGTAVSDCVINRGTAASSTYEGKP